MDGLMDGWTVGWTDPHNSNCTVCVVNTSVNQAIDASD